MEDSIMLMSSLVNKSHFFIIIIFSFFYIIVLFKSTNLIYTFMQACVHVHIYSMVDS